jgi:hypothetical protein
MKPSPATFKEEYKKANDFSLRNTDLEAFKKSAEEMGLQVTPVDELRSDSVSYPVFRMPTARGHLGEPCRRRQVERTHPER